MASHLKPSVCSSNLPISACLSGIQKIHEPCFFFFVSGTKFTIPDSVNESFFFSAPVLEQVRNIIDLSPNMFRARSLPEALGSQPLLPSEIHGHTL